ncbi:13605_t:CDS:2 [Funneliformis geosporum]|uniref:protein-tyrosine-phosphatase n=1 Tax=Funneliformis geosporum TaxID=1117311 RepID=A0A9W4SF87_9GLOM|nr:13605_t:CDS:2 [Funneliformis geosporum]
MTSALKRSYPFDSFLLEDINQYKVPQTPLLKRISMAPPNVNVSVNGSASWKMSTTTFTKQNISNELTISANHDQNFSSAEKSPLPSPPSSKGRRNMKNLQLVVPPVRSSISAPPSPQLLPTSTTSHNRRPSTPLCIYQNKGSNSIVADPMALMSKTENAIGEDLPYKNEPIQILPNLYLGSELNAANRSMLNRINVEFILNVGKEVENPYLDEITNVNSSYSSDFQQQISPGLPTSSSISSEDSFMTAIQSPSLPLDSPIVPSSPFGILRSNSLLQKRISLTLRTSSSSPQLAHESMLSGVPLTVPATSEFKTLKYKKFFWTHNQENLISDFKSAFAFIDEARSAGRNILVHCQCGVSRSASLIIGYVMKANKMTLNQAYEFVKDRSPYISPNMSLVYQLVEFEKTLKLGMNNSNSIPNSPHPYGKDDLKKTHSRNSSIESDLLLSHRRSNSLSRGNLRFLNIPQQRQATVKGRAGRFHVITASITPSSLSPALSSASSSVSSSSSSESSLLSYANIASPTNSSSEESSPTNRLRRSSKPPPLSPKTSNSSLNTFKNASRSSYSPIDRNPLSPKGIIFNPMSPQFVPESATMIYSSTSHDKDPFVSFSNFENSFGPSRTSNISFHSFDKTTSFIMNQRNHEVLSGPNSGIFSKSTFESIFSPTRVSPPVTPVAIPDLFA